MQSPCPWGSSSHRGLPFSNHRPLHVIIRPAVKDMTPMQVHYKSHARGRQCSGANVHPWTIFHTSNVTLRSQVDVKASLPVAPSKVTCMRAITPLVSRHFGHAWVTL